MDNMEKIRINGVDRIVFSSNDFREKILFDCLDGVKSIRIPKWFEDNPNEYLRSVDLDGVCWNNVDVRGHDFSGTNASINPRVVYKRSLENTNLEGMNLSMYSFRGVNINNANLCFTGAHLYRTEKSVDLELIQGCHLNGSLVTMLVKGKNFSKTLRKKK